MAAHMITREEVIERSSKLPSLPSIVAEILATLDDPDSNLKVLVDHIAHDPVIAARVLSRANAASSRTRRLSAISDIYTATTMIGMGSVREMALISSVGGFSDSLFPACTASAFWAHSVAVGVCSEELALHTAGPVSADAALIAGLLHDIGQLWLFRFKEDDFRTAWSQALHHRIGIEKVEREQFGVDHSTIGFWLAEHWLLPHGIGAAIRHHHAPKAAMSEALVPLVHVAEVLSNALDLTGRDENRVTTISATACQKLGLVWDASARPLFGRMEARSRHAGAFFQQAV